MSNGNNNGHNHNGTAIAARNGNGAHNDPATIDGHELLWDGLSPAVTNALGQPLDPALVSQRKGRAGRTFDYLEGHVVFAQANRIFGFGGWGYELVGDVTLRQIETVDSQTGEIKIASAYSAPVRVTVAGALPRTDTGFHLVTDDTLDGHDTAIKAAVTDGMKRAFRSFGLQFGNGFYGDPSTGSGEARQPVSAAPRPQSVPARARGNSGQAQPDNRVQTLRKRLIEIAIEQGFDEAKVADRRPEADGQGPGRPDGGRARGAGGGRRQQAAGEAGAGGLVHRSIEDTQSSGTVPSGAAPLSHYRKERRNGDDDLDVHTLGLDETGSAGGRGSPESLHAQPRRAEAEQ